MWRRGDKNEKLDHKDGDRGTLDSGEYGGIYPNGSSTKLWGRDTDGSTANNCLRWKLFTFGTWMLYGELCGGDTGD